MLLDNRTVAACYLLLAVAYLGGLAVPLMNNDSAHHATIALHMHLSGDYLALVTQGKDYLDKPHLLFWLSALSFKLFGVTTFAYKLPSLLFSVLAVHSTRRLGELLHGAEAGRVAGLVLASALAFVLANNDVRMDALLTGAIAFATWQLAAFVEHGRWRQLVLGAVGLALGFSTKGMIGVAMPLIAIFLHLLWRRAWARLFDWRWLVLAALTALFVAPVLYAYHHQFGARGVRFILWSQNFERLAGERFGRAGANDPLFFVHTFLWAFLPWSLLTLGALWAQGCSLLRARLRPVPGGEALTLGTLAVLFAIISASQFKLPHYLNILLPFFAIATGAWLAPRLAQPAGRGAVAAQWLAAALLAVFALALNGWVFPLTGLAVAGGALAVAAAGVLLARRQRGGARLVVASVAVAAVFNFLLNFNFFPQLLGYQAGNNLAAARARLGIPVDAVSYLENHGRAGSYDFYTARLTPTLSLQALRAGPLPQVIYTSATGRAALVEAGLPVRTLASTPDFRVTRLNARFLDPKRRPDTLDEYFLLQVGE